MSRTGGRKGARPSKTWSGGQASSKISALSFYFKDTILGARGGGADGTRLCSTRERGRVQAEHPCDFGESPHPRDARSRGLDSCPRPRIGAARRIDPQPDALVRL